MNYLTELMNVADCCVDASTYCGYLFDEQIDNSGSCQNNCGRFTKDCWYVGLLGRGK